MDLRDRFWGIYRLLGEVWHLPDGRGPLSLGARRVDPSLFLPLLGATLGLNVLLYGERGTGKTTLAKLIASLLTGLPYSYWSIAMLRLNPEIIEEKVFGYLDIAALNRGEVRIVWGNFAKSPFLKILDEVFRIPPAKDAIFFQPLEGDGAFQFRQNTLFVGEFSILATGNPPDQGSFEAVIPFCDRFAVAVELGYIGPKHTKRILQGKCIEEQVADLGLNDGFREALKAAELPGEEGVQALKELGEGLKKRRAQKGIPVLFAEDIASIRAEAEAIPISTDVEDFFAFFNSILWSCTKYRQKRSTEPCPSSCEFFKTLCSWTPAGGSQRIVNDVRSLARGLAWTLEKPHVELDLIAMLLPFTFWHRTKFHPNLREWIDTTRRLYNFELFAAQRLVAEIVDLFLKERVHLRQTLLDNPAEVKNPFLWDLITEAALQGEREIK